MFHVSRDCYTVLPSSTPQLVVTSLTFSVMSDSLQPHGLYSPYNSIGQNTRGSSLSLLQGIFLTQGLNPGLPHCRQMLYTLSHQGSPDNKIILVIEVLIVIIIFFKVIVAIATVYLLCIMFWALFWWGTRVHPWRMHVDVWQNQYNFVK